MQWSDEDFIRRVESRAAALGKTLPEVVSEARVAKEYFRKTPLHGRNIAGIFKLAEILKIDPAELMGLRKRRRKPAAEDHDLAAAVGLAVAVYCTLKQRRDDEIAEVIAKAIKAVRREFGPDFVPPEVVPSE